MRWTLLCLLFIIATPIPALAAAAIRATGLECDGERRPLAVGRSRPDLSWRVEAVEQGARGVRQSAYRILAASDRALLKPGKADLWDSGVVRSSETLQIAYEGRPLKSRERVWWTVQVWDQQARAAPAASPTWFEAGLLTPGDWSAEWIQADRPPAADAKEMYGERPAPLLRREFHLKAVPKSSRCYVIGLGYFELYINGRRVGDQQLHPAWTDYRKRLFYSTYDVTGLLRPGANSIAMELGSGWWDPLPLPLFGRFNLRDWLAVGEPRALLQLEMRDARGGVTTITSDREWRWREGPTLRNSIYLGEHYDARREQPGWTGRVAVTESGWKPVEIASAPGGVVEPHPLPPIRVIEKLSARRVRVLPDGASIWDAGRNLAGRVRLRVLGKPGARVTLRLGELLHPDGSLNVMTSVTGQIKRARPDLPHQPAIAWQEDSYTLKGEGIEEWAPRFTFHGFRYIEARITGEAAISGMDAEAMSSDVKSAGDFTCSNQLFNQIQKMVRRTILSNLFSVQSDCPHREKLGYGGDIVATSEALIFNYDMESFYRKTVLDFADAQRENGGFTETAPFVGIADQSLGDGAGPVGWGTAHPLLLVHLWRYYGDHRTAREQMERAQAWLRLIESRSVAGILDNGISDHEALTPRPRALTGTAFHFWNAKLLAELASRLGRPAEAKGYEESAAGVRAAFNRKFLQPNSGRYGDGTQTEQAFPLYLDMIPRAEIGMAHEILVKSVTEKPGHLTTGIFGTKFMLGTLTDGGRADIAARVVDRKEFPGWGHMLARGATTLWEHWEFSDNVYSHNHPMFGSVSEWFFRGLGGVNPDQEASGFDLFTLRPQPVEEVDWVRCSYRSRRGLIRCDWRKEGGGLALDIEVPANTSCTLFLPATPEATVTEGGRGVAQADGVTSLFEAPGARVLRLGSGRYRFRVSAIPPPRTD